MWHVARGDAARCVGAKGRRLCHLYDASSIFEFFDGDVDGVGREEFFNEFGPFDEAGAGCVEIVVGANVYGFCEVLDAVEIEVVDGAFKEVAVVLVDDGEGGGVDHVFYAEHFTQCLDKGRFTGTHLSVESENLGGLFHEFGGGNKLFGRSFDCV